MAREHLASACPWQRLLGAEAEWTVCVIGGLLPPPPRGRDLHLLGLQLVEKAMASCHFLTRSCSL